MEKSNKVILCGIQYYDECSYTAENIKILATFDNQELADEYVLNSVEKDLPLRDTMPRAEFKKGSLLVDSDYYLIYDYDIPNNPVLKV